MQNDLSPVNRDRGSNLCSLFKSISTKPSDSGNNYQIPVDAIKDIRSDSFLGDGSKTPLDHLQMIEKIFSLFKLYGISQEVKSKLFYLSLIGIILFRTRTV
jgi:hypothetical protein